MQIIPHGYSNHPDLRHLQVFDVLLREHSLTRAARELDVTQPAQHPASCGRWYETRPIMVNRRVPLAPK
jgi:hypothetical protein